MLSHQQYLDLIIKVNEFRNQAHLFDNEVISESALDSLKKQITDFENSNPDLISFNSSNYTIAGGISEGFQKVAHSRRMLSLNDIFDLEELIDWERKWQDYAKNNGINYQPDQSYICEPKIDGLAISLHYDNGQLVRGITRGDGFFGEDVTNNVLQITGIPKTIPDLRQLEVRGEIFMTLSGFADLNQSILNGTKTGKLGKTGLEGIFANHRNVASGTIRQLDSRIVGERNLSFVAYNIYITSEVA